MPDASSDDAATAPECGHEPAVAYEVGFAVGADVDAVADIDSACAMRATVHEVPVGSEDADAVGCAVASCEHHHERVAADLRATAARHSGNVGAGGSCRVDRDDGDDSDASDDGDD
ncbi:hypothetical protein [Halorubellus sp. PRR65]|uniref:hypothetical protein n=1 Tax=Halorubellus sp. PRR65 TaxID=3098148 RepID=UPI002B25D736|nr:hypothetical protein [Halorubellus sp. PRR65]